METEQLTEERLIDFAKQHGYEQVNHWKLERWHKEDVIPRPVVERLGYGKGTRSTYPTQTSAQILAVCRLLKSTRSFNVIRFQLWQEGYPISLSALKKSIRQLAPLLKWTIPSGGEEQQYEVAEQQVDTLLGKLTKRRPRFLSRVMKRLSFENFQSFLTIQMYLLYGIHYVFEPSHYKGELSSADILAQGLNLDELRFLPQDLTQDFQRFSWKELLSIGKMKAALDEATEEDLKQANAQADFVALTLEFFDLIGFLPELWQVLQLGGADSSFQAMSLVFVLHFKKWGFADNIDGLLKVLRVQIPRIRASQTVYFALQHELPAVAKEIGAPQQIWQRIKDLSESEREQYFARKNEYLHGIYLQYQAELDAFSQRHPEVKNAIEAGDPSSL